MVAHLTGQPEVSSLKEPSSGQRGSPSIVYGAPASEETVQVWLLSPEKKPLLVVARRGVSGDPCN